MLEMKQCIDIAKYEEFIPQSCIAPLILESVDNNCVTGFIIFEYEPDTVIIYTLEFGEDLALCDGLVRSAMFKALMANINTAKFELCDEKSIQACTKLRFIRNDEKTININEILGGCQGCRNAN